MSEARQVAGETEKGKRKILPNADVMIHQVIGRSEGQASDIQIATERILALKKRMNKIISKNTGNSLDKIETDCDRDHYFSAKEAKEYGIVDEVI